MRDERSTPMTPVRVWDLPTRLFHWSLVVLVSGSLLTALIGGNAMVWHFRCGFAIFTLLLFRLLWGFMGGHWSRFVSFVYAPSTVLRYLRGQHRPGEHLDVGHSPLGSLSVFALLAVLAAQVGSGLFADDEISNVGPLNRFVSNDRAADLTGWHTEFGPWIIGALVMLHIAAIAFYVGYRKRKLVRAMVDGDKPLPTATPASADSAGSRLFALILLLMCAAVVRWLVSLGG